MFFAFAMFITKKIEIKSFKKLYLYLLKLVIKSKNWEIKFKVH